FSPKQTCSRSSSGSGRHRYIGKLTATRLGPRFTPRCPISGRTSAASSVLVLPLGPALRRVSLLLRAALLPSARRPLVLFSLAWAQQLLCAWPFSLPLAFSRRPRPYRPIR